MLPITSDLRDLDLDELRATDGGKRVSRWDDPIMILPVEPLPIESVTFA